MVDTSLNGKTWWFLECRCSTTCDALSLIHIAEVRLGFPLQIIFCMLRKC